MTGPTGFFSCLQTGSPKASVPKRCHSAPPKLREGLSTLSDVLHVAPDNQFAVFLNAELKLESNHRSQNAWFEHEVLILHYVANRKRFALLDIPTCSLYSLRLVW